MNHIVSWDQWNAQMSQIIVAINMSEYCFYFVLQYYLIVSKS